jgi:hypothetical protein
MSTWRKLCNFHQVLHPFAIFDLIFFLQCAIFDFYNLLSMTLLSWGSFKACNMYVLWSTWRWRDFQSNKNGGKGVLGCICLKV